VLQHMSTSHKQKALSISLKSFCSAVVCLSSNNLPLEQVPISVDWRLAFDEDIRGVTPSSRAFIYPVHISFIRDMLPLYSSRLTSCRWLPSEGVLGKKKDCTLSSCPSSLCLFSLVRRENNRTESSYRCHRGDNF